MNLLEIIIFKYLVQQQVSNSTCLEIVDLKSNISNNEANWPHLYGVEFTW